MSPDNISIINVIESQLPIDPGAEQVYLSGHIMAALNAVHRTRVIKPTHIVMEWWQ